MCSDCEVRVLLDKPICTSLYHGRMIHNDEKVVVKVGNETQFTRLFKEYCNLCLLSDVDGVIKSRGFYVEDGKAHLILEPGGIDLHDLPPMPESEVVPTIQQLIRILLQMKHDHDVCHGDLSLCNTLLDPNTGKVTLIDLEYACKQDESRYHYTGKAGFLAPEAVEMGQPIDVFAKDIFSLGVCAFVLLTNKDLYRQPYDRRFNAILKPAGLKRTLERDQKYLGIKFSKRVESFLLKALDPNPASRATLEDLQDHPLFTDKSHPSRFALCDLI